MPGSPTGVTDEGWRGLLDAARDAYISIDASGEVTEWNRQAEQLFGWTRSEVVGSLLAERIVPPELRDAHLLGLRRFVTTGHGRVVFQRLRLPALHRSGRRFEIEFTIWPSRDADGAWQFHAFLHDVSAEVQQQAYLHLLQRAAVAANEADTAEHAIRATLEAILEATGVALGHAYLVEEAAPANLVPTGWWAPAPRAALAEATAGRPFPLGVGLPGRVAGSGRPDWISDLTRDVNFPRADAAAASGLRSAFAFPIATGSEVVAVLEFFSEDVHEPDRSLLEVLAIVGTQLGRVFERERAVRELHLAANQRQTIVSIVSHELRGPLATTHAAADLLRGELGAVRDDEDTVATLLDLLDRELARMRRMVDDLLTAQRLDARSLSVRPVRVTVADAVRRVAADAALEDVVVDVDDDLAVHADPDHVTQVLWNLLTNARAHGRPPITVAAHRTSGGTVGVEVRDRGPGVPATLVPRLFDRFARGHESSGSGLGLAIARGLARANGGDVTYQHGPGGAPAFVVTLPRALEDRRLD